MPQILSPPSASLLPPAPDLRARLAVALQEVDLLRRLLRVVTAHPPTTITTNTHLSQAEGKGVSRG